jgi:hypothetical protein
MVFKKLGYFFIISILCMCHCTTLSAQETLKQSASKTLIIIGAGAGGTAAAIQAARMGVKVHLLSENPWLGGMLTAAGVSAIDGNHQLPSGLWGEFRTKLYQHYGGPEAVATGWVSNTHFEPKVGDSILKSMAQYPHLIIHYNTQFKSISKRENGWDISFVTGGKTTHLSGAVVIDGTENGDVIPLVGAEFNVGMDAQSDTGEKEAPKNSNSIVQDLTYTIILKDLGRDAKQNELLTMHPSYEASLFECACRLPGSDTPKGVVDHIQMLDYAKLPGNKYLINWPNCGNDYFLDWPNMPLDEVQKGILEAKQHSLNFVYYIQHELGFKNLVVHNEFGTDDSFPWIPYHRESRRLKGLVQLTVNEVRNPYAHDLFKTGIAVGDYPIDHHHDKNLHAPEIDFIGIKVPSYNVPLGSLIPKETPHFIVAEKNISVSNIVNGATRLQPVVLGIGQAAGALAALALKEGIQPKEVTVRNVQKALLAEQVYLMPFIDVMPTENTFYAIQKIGATGILKGQGIPYKWANQTWFYPNAFLSQYALLEELKKYYPALDGFEGSGEWVDYSYLKILIESTGFALKPMDKSALTSLGLPNYNSRPKTPLNRGAIAQMLDAFLDPFSLEIDHHGKIILRD